MWIEHRGLYYTHHCRIQDVFWRCWDASHQLWARALELLSQACHPLFQVLYLDHCGSGARCNNTKQYSTRLITERVQCENNQYKDMKRLAEIQTDGNKVRNSIEGMCHLHARFY